jgi:hypothetical protein
MRASDEGLISADGDEGYCAATGVLQEYLEALQVDEDLSVEQQRCLEILEEVSEAQGNLVDRTESGMGFLETVQTRELGDLLSRLDFEDRNDVRQAVANIANACARQGLGLFVGAMP